MGRLVWVKKRKTKAYNRATGEGQQGHWDDKKKLEVLTTYLATGSPTLTCAMTGIPLHTFKTWKYQPWWKEQTTELQQENNLKLDKKLEKVMDKALDAVLDRVENGEFMYDPRSGDIMRVPAKLRDVQKVAGDMIDKRQLLNKIHKGKENDKQQITADHLVQLAAEFAKFANGNPKHVPEEHTVKSVIEGEHQEIFDAIGVEQVTKDV
jgi:hypothetical protein